MLPDADKSSIFNVMRIVSNCSNFCKLVTFDAITHNPIDTDEGLEVYINIYIRLTRLTSLSIYRCKR